jgi:hypothetical protein
MGQVRLALALAVLTLAGCGPDPDPPVAPPEPITQAGVRAGTLCAPERAKGITVDGPKLECRATPDDPEHPRWRRPAAS